MILSKKLFFLFTILLAASALGQTNTPIIQPPKGKIELTAKLLESFPERVEYKEGYLDCEFLSVEDGNSVRARFSVRDKNGDVFPYVFAPKDKFADMMLSLKRGEHLRIIGKAMPHYDGELNGPCWLNADTILRLDAIGARAK